MYKHTKLKNGVNVITIPVKGTQAVTVLAMFPVGSRYETPELSGAAHFVEHMLFKGTTKRPTAQDISRSVEAVGAEYNAFTYKDYTGYYVKVDAAKQEIAFDLISDMLFNSKFDPAEVIKEKGPVVEEIRLYKDNPSSAIDLVGDQLVYGNNPLGWDICGTEDTIGAMTREALWQFYQHHYSTKNVVLVVAGNVNPKVMKRMTNYFGVQQSPKTACGPAYYQSHYDTFTWPKKKLAWADRLAVETRTVDQAQVLLNFPGLKSNHPKRHALAVLSVILGGGMSSRLFVEVREKRGLAYMVHAGTSSFRDSGLCYIQAGLDPKRLGEALTVIRDEIKRIATVPVTAEELRDAKNNMTGHLALSMENSSAQAQWYARQYFFSASIITPVQAAKLVQQVTAKQVQQVAKELLDWETARLAVISPYSKETILGLLPS